MTIENELWGRVVYVISSGLRWPKPGLGLRVLRFDQLSPIGRLSTQPSNQLESDRSCHGVSKTP